MHQKEQVGVGVKHWDESDVDTTFEDGWLGGTKHDLKVAAVTDYKLVAKHY